MFDIGKAGGDDMAVPSSPIKARHGISKQHLRPEHSEQCYYSCSTQKDWGKMSPSLVDMVLILDSTEPGGGGGVLPEGKDILCCVIIRIIHVLHCCHRIHLSSLRSTT
ncbi:kinase family protein [Sesbania bispinosa]|nr:kinase family protein [Sesbania bispinosa]